MVVIMLSTTILLVFQFHSKKLFYFTSNDMKQTNEKM